MVAAVNYDGWVMAGENDNRPKQLGCEALFRSFFENAVIGAAITDPDDRWHMVNARLAQMLGYTPDELRGMSWRDLTPPEDLPAEDARIREILAVGDSGVREKRYRRKDGTSVDVEVFTRIIRGADGTVQHYLALISDITERKRAEKNLRMMVDMLDEAPSSITVHDFEGRCLYANSRTFEIHRCDEREFMSLNLHELDVPESEALISERMRLITEKGEATFEVGHFRKDRSTVRLEVFVRKVEWDGVPAMLSIVTDITERKRAEEVLHEAERSLSRAQAMAHVGDWEWDITTNAVRWSDEVYRIYGFEPHSVKPDYGLVLEQMHSASKDEFLRAIDGALKEDRPFDMEYRFFEKEGKQKVLHTIGRVIRDAAGNPIRMLGTVQDITERKRAEEEHEKLYDRVIEVGRLESVGRLAGGIAHEFNNMLAVVLGNVELALEHVDPENPVYADLNEVHKAAQRSASLVRQLLGFARKQTTVPKVIDLNDAVVRMLGMLRRLIGEDIDLSWSPGADLWPVRIDSYQIDQILTNLCANSRDAIAGVGRVTVETRNITVNQPTVCACGEECPPGECVLLSVSDDGCGMSETTQSHLFEPFFTTKPFGQGAGLGLASVYGIVRQNQGFISVESQPGKGTTFRIYLPRYRTENTEIRSDSALQTRHDVVATAGEKLPGLGQTVLLVEDDAAMLRLACRFLERLGYNVLKADRPDEALRIAETRDIGILVTDVVMPGIDGRELATRIGARMPNLKYLFMSAYPVEVLASRGILHADMHFIQKPFTLESLGEAISRLNGGA